MEFWWNPHFRRWCCAATLVVAPVAIWASTPGSNQITATDAQRLPAADGCSAARIPTDSTSAAIQLSQFTTDPRLWWARPKSPTLYRLPPTKPQHLIHRLPPVTGEIPATANSATDVSATEVSGPSVSGPSVSETDVAPPEFAAQEVVGPETTSPEVVTPEVVTPEVTPSEISTPEVIAQEVVSPAVVTPEVTDSRIGHAEPFPPATPPYQIGSEGSLDASADALGTIVRPNARLIAPNVAFAKSPWTPDTNADLILPISEVAEPRPRISNDPLDLLPPTVEHDWNDRKSPMPGVAEQAAQAVRRASNLARRGATYSSVEELEASLEMIAVALDNHYGTTAFTQCYRTGQLALEEAADFTPPHAGRRSSLEVDAVVSRHQSRVLTAEEAQQLSPAEAARRYYAYAQEHLAAAAGGAPIAAHAMFGLGKLYLARSQPGSDAERLYGARAMAMHQTALLVDRTHALAANELGVMLAHLGRLKEAREVLAHGLSVGAPPESWRNLADVHERMGETALANQARSEWQRSTQLAQRGNHPQMTAWNGTNIRWVDKTTFERGSLEGATPPSLREQSAPSSGPYVAAPNGSAPHTAVQRSHPAMGRW